jgi:hypothetical protein
MSGAQARAGLLAGPRAWCQLRAQEQSRRAPGDGAPRSADDPAGVDGSEHGAMRAPRSGHRGGVTNSRPSLKFGTCFPEGAVWLKCRCNLTRQTSAHMHFCRAFAHLKSILHSCRKIGRSADSAVQRRWLRLSLSLARREGAPGGRRRSIPGHGPPRLTQRPIESEARKGSSTSGGARARRTGIHRGTVRNETDGAFAVGSGSDAASCDA